MSFLNCEDLYCGKTGLYFAQLAYLSSWDLPIYDNPGSTKLGPILFAHAVRAWANVVVTQGIAQGVSNIGPSLGRVRKQYWAKIVHNFATRVKVMRDLYYLNSLNYSDCYLTTQLESHIKKICVYKNFKPSLNNF